MQKIKKITCLNLFADFNVTAFNFLFIGGMTFAGYEGLEYQLTARCDREITYHGPALIEERDTAP